MNKEDKLKRKLEKEEDKAFALAVKQRDNMQCAICNSNHILHTHHIIPRENRLFRHDLDNGITLCCLHHKFSLDISPHRNAFVFIRWLANNRPLQFERLMIKIANFEDKQINTNAELKIIS